MGLVVYALYGVRAGVDMVAAATGSATPGTASIPTLLISGLRAGLLTFGAYIL